MGNAADRSAFGKLLREFRVAAGLSQQELAERARLSVDAIGALERGINRAPQRETLALLVGALQLEAPQRQAFQAAAKRSSSPRTAGRTFRRSNLPRQLTPLFGRERDLSTIRELISRSTLLTLTGAGGIGKTRLAVEAGLSAQRQYSDGVWFVDLAPVRDAAGVAAAIGAVFGLRERPEKPLLDAVARALERKKLILILDNCEHLAAAAAAAVETLLGVCHDARILATSRQPLNVSGEQTYRVASLDSEACVALFAEAARRADPTFTLDEADLPTAERIGRRLDGIALAIELAAARVKFLSLAQIEENLSQRFLVLTGGARLARHRTMLAAIDWSYDLLCEEERVLFDRLGVFAADYDFDAAQAIAAGDGVDEARVLELLGSLVDKSLVTSERQGKVRRFRLLEAMRAYAREKLGTSLDALRRSHAEYYLELAETAASFDQPSFASLEAEYANFQQALRWSIDVGADVAIGVRLLASLREFLLLRGLTADSARRAERALENVTALPPGLEALAWEILASMLGDLLLPAKAFEAAHHALELYERLGARAGEARALRARGVAFLRLGEFSRGEEDLQRALELAKTYGSRRDVASTLGSIAVCHEISGKLDQGRTVMLEVLQMARAAGDRRMEWVSQLNLAETEFALGQTASAFLRLEELLADKLVRKNVRMRANTESNLAAYLIALHRAEEAMRMAVAAVFDAREAGDTGILSCALGHLAAIVAPHDPSTAARLLGFVESIFADGYRRENTERFTHGLLLATLHEAMSEDAIAMLVREGAAMSEAQAIRLATRARSDDPV